MNKTTLPPLEEVDRSKAFTPEQYEEILTLPEDERRAYMARPNSQETMTETERLKHYQSKNFPVIKYGPNWTLTPPKTKR